MQRILAAALLAVSMAAGATVWAQGCPPGDTTADKCQTKVAKATGKLLAAIVTCHVKEADGAFKGTPFDDEACESQDPAKSALAKYQKSVAKLLPTCPSAVVAATQAAIDALLSGPSSVDAQNGLVYCDPSSGTPIGGDDAGFVPATSASSKCADGVAKAGAKLGAAVVGCRSKALDLAFKGKTYDLAGCLSKALTTFGTATGKLTGCAACLSAAQKTAVGDAMRAQADALIGGVFVCPTTTTTTSTTTTTGPTTTTLGATTTTTAGATTTTTTLAGGVACPANGIIRVVATLVPASDGSTAPTIGGLKVSLTYPPSVGLPGTGSLPVNDPTDPTTRELLLDFALYNGLVLFVDNDAVLVTTVATAAQTPIQLVGPYPFEEARFTCSVGTIIAPDAFACSVIDESNPLGSVIPPDQRPACSLAVTP